MISRLLGRLWKLPPPTSAVERQRNVPVVVRDGTVLLADLYVPRGVASAPTVLMRSPYGRGSLFGVLGQIFAERGYQTVVQSCRGVFGSGGRFNPFFQERDDGIDTVSWIEKQPWHAGKLGLYGASYLGFVQWAVAAELGHRVSAMAVGKSTSDFHAAMFDGGAFRLEDFLTWTSIVFSQEKGSVLLRALRDRILGDPLRSQYAKLPLATIDDQAFGEEIGYWRTWLAHDAPADPFWEPIQCARTLERIEAPVTMVTGWSDVFIHCQIRDFKTLRASGKISRLTVGPWTHTNSAGTAESVRDCLDWFAAYLQGSGSVKAPDRVRLWVQGANEWRDHSSWPPRGATPFQMSLSGEGHLVNGEPQSMRLTFTYDPRNPTPSLEGPKLTSKTGRGDMSPLVTRRDVLVFDGPVLVESVELVGDLSVSLTTTANGPHHDLFVCLCDVDPDGRAVNITDGYRRLPPASPPDVCRQTIVEGQPANWYLPPGHRLRLLVAGGAFPRYARNLGLGGRLGDERESRTVEITVHHGSLGLSAVESRGRTPTI